MALMGTSFIVAMVALHLAAGILMLSGLPQAVYDGRNALHWKRFVRYETMPMAVVLILCLAILVTKFLLPDVIVVFGHEINVLQRFDDFVMHRVLTKKEAERLENARRQRDQIQDTFRVSTEEDGNVVDYGQHYKPSEIDHYKEEFSLKSMVWVEEAVQTRKVPISLRTVRIPQGVYLSPYIHCRMI